MPKLLKLKTLADCQESRADCTRRLAAATELVQELMRRGDSGLEGMKRQAEACVELDAILDRAHELGYAEGYAAGLRERDECSPDEGDPWREHENEEVRRMRGR